MHPAGLLVGLVAVRARRALPQLGHDALLAVQNERVAGVDFVLAMRRTLHHLAGHVQAQDQHAFFRQFKLSDGVAREPRAVLHLDLSTV